MLIPGSYRIATCAEQRLARGPIVPARPDLAGVRTTPGQCDYDRRSDLYEPERLTGGRFTRTDRV